MQDAGFVLRGSHKDAELFRENATVMAAVGLQAQASASPTISPVIKGATALQFQFPYLGSDKFLWYLSCLGLTNARPMWDSRCSVAPACRRLRRRVHRLLQRFHWFCVWELDWGGPLGRSLVACWVRGRGL